MYVCLCNDNPEPQTERKNEKIWIIMGRLRVEPLVFGDDISTSLFFLELVHFETDSIRNEIFCKVFRKEHILKIFSFMNNEANTE